MELNEIINTSVPLNLVQIMNLIDSQQHNQSISILDFDLKEGDEIKVDGRKAIISRIFEKENETQISVTSIGQ